MQKSAEFLYTNSDQSGKEVMEMTPPCWHLKEYDTYE